MIFFITTFLAVSFSSGMGLSAISHEEDKLQWRYGEQVCKGQWSYANYKNCEDTKLEPTKWKDKDTEEIDSFTQFYKLEYGISISCREKNYTEEKYCAAHQAPNGRTNNEVKAGKWDYPNRKGHPYTCPAGSEYVRTSVRNCKEIPRWDNHDFELRNFRSRRPQEKKSRCDIVLTCSVPAFKSVNEYVGVKDCPSEHQKTRDDTTNPISWTCNVPVEWPSTRREFCEEENETLFTPPNTKWDVNDTTKTKRPITSDEGAFGSACFTCDDLPVSTVGERQAKLKCLFNSYFTADIPDYEEQYSSRTKNEIIASIIKLHEQSEKMDKDDEFTFSEEDSYFIMDYLIPKHSSTRFDNPLIFPEFINVGFNFQEKIRMSRNSLVEGYYADYGRFSPAGMFNKRWIAKNDSSLSEELEAVNVEGIEDLEKEELALASHVAFTANTDWRVVLPKGKYLVTIGVSEFSGFEGTPTHQVILNGEEFLRFTPDPLVADLIQSKVVEKEIELNGVYLTLSTSELAKTKIAFIRIKRK